MGHLPAAGRPMARARAQARTQAARLAGEPRLFRKAARQPKQIAIGGRRPLRCALFARACLRDDVDADGASCSAAAAERSPQAARSLAGWLASFGASAARNLKRAAQHTSSGTIYERRRAATGSKIASSVEHRARMSCRRRSRLQPASHTSGGGGGRGSAVPAGRLFYARDNNTAHHVAESVRVQDTRLPSERTRLPSEHTATGSRQCKHTNG